ncbi:MAG: hypothetical protein FWF99_03305 [Desulfovibrionaceae bacterium]|nr:hypothetical protein [Desulfovibrionaceae bacterium]
MYILKDFISASDLRKRWGCQINLIESFTYNKDDDSPRLQRWELKETRRRPDGGLSAFAEFVTAYGSFGIELDSTIFDMGDVQAIEREHPEIIAPPKESSVTDRLNAALKALDSEERAPEWRSEQIKADAALVSQPPFDRQRIKDLEAELAAARQQIAELTTAQSAPCTAPDETAPLPGQA